MRVRLAGVLLLAAILFVSPIAGCASSGRPTTTTPSGHVHGPDCNH